jgi:hypothetical protein
MSAQKAGQRVDRYSKPNRVPEVKSLDIKVSQGAVLAPPEYHDV